MCKDKLCETCKHDDPRGLGRCQLMPSRVTMRGGRSLAACGEYKETNK